MKRYNPLNLTHSLWSNRVLIIRLARREIESRYRGSLLGVIWTVLNPLLLLAVYTFVFSVVFQSKWDLPVDNKANFALILFLGLIIFNIFSENISRAPTLMIANSVYIKKVVFPLEILPVVSLFSSLFNFLISLLVLIIFYTILIDFPPLTVFLLPLAVLPNIFLVLGLSWFLASLGVYVRDIQQVIGVLIMIAMFMSPLFYPISALPDSIEKIVQFSPIALAIEQSRTLLFIGQIPEQSFWLVSLMLSMIVAYIGYLWFELTRKGFADVL